MPLIEPDRFTCPITSALLVDAVITSDGQTYERTAIAKWLTDHDTSPATNLRLSNKTLISVPLVKEAVAEWKKHANICSDAQFLKAVKTGRIDTLNQLCFISQTVEHRSGRH